jgi:hypothetical protein
VKTKNTSSRLCTIRTGEKICGSRVVPEKHPGTARTRVPRGRVAGRSSSILYSMRGKSFSGVGHVLAAIAQLLGEVVEDVTEDDVVNVLSEEVEEEPVSHS